MIIVEGPDNSGKSTLVRELSHRLGWPTHHPGGPPKTEDERVLRMCEQMIIRDQNIIYDRCTCISDQVYRQLIGISMFDQFTFLMTRHQSVKVIYCRPPLSKLMDLSTMTIEEHDTEEQLALVRDKQRIIVAGYDYVMDRIPRVIRFDYTKNTIEEVLECLK